MKCQKLQHEKINIYLSARISEDAHKWNNHVCGHLTTPLNVFLPQDHNPCDVEHVKLEKKIYDIDLEAMINSDFGLLLPPYGRDCAWEVGWYANSNKPLIVYVHNQIDWLRDWMIKGGLDYLFTTDRDTFEKLKKDPILKHKPVKFIHDVSMLKDCFMDLYNETQLLNELLVTKDYEVDYL